MTIHRPIAPSPDRSARTVTVADFLLLERNGLFRDHAKVELLDGEIYGL